MNWLVPSPGVLVAFTIWRASTWSSVFMVGAGGPGGVSGPWAKMGDADKPRMRTATMLWLVHFMVMRLSIVNRPIAWVGDAWDSGNRHSLIHETQANNFIL